jgi:hypothetical protein
MSGVRGKLPSLFKGIVFGLVLAAGIFGSTTSVAADPTSGGSVTISAQVAAVRYILVDNHNRVRQILSNTVASVAPVVYRGSFKSVPIGLTPDIAGQYSAIMAHLNVHRTGVIYQAKVVANRQPVALASWLRLNYSRPNF